MFPVHNDFTSLDAWLSSAKLMDSLKLDYRQLYYKWVELEIEETVYDSGSLQFQNLITTESGNIDVHLIYETINPFASGELSELPEGFTFFSFTDSLYLTRNYSAIQFALQKLNNVKWLSIGNEIDIIKSLSNVYNGHA